MTHAAVLDVIARLYVDPDFRGAFLRDRAAALAPLGLPANERDALASLDPRSISILGRMADYHRVSRIQEHLAWVDEGRRPGLAAVLARFLQSTPPALLNRDEAIAFCRFLEREADPSPPYLKDLARYERLRIEVAWGVATNGPSPYVASFDFAIPQIIEAMSAPGWPDAAPSPTRLALKKVPGIPAILVRPAC